MIEKKPKKKPFFVSVPYRGATLLNEELENLEVKFNLVSVPYRGATLLNNISVTVTKQYFVSVPYRGATLLNEAAG